MKGFYSQLFQYSSLVICLAIMTGCCGSYDELVDPCYPQRYNAIAREEVQIPLATQANNGLILDQTVWEYHFKDGSDELNNLGKSHLDRLARRRPAPVLDVFLQTAQNITYEQGKPQETVDARNKLNEERTKAVKDYLAAVRPDLQFNITVHNPSGVGMHGVEKHGIILQMHTSGVGSPAGVSSGAVSTGGGGGGRGGSGNSGGREDEGRGGGGY